MNTDQLINPKRKRVVKINKHAQALGRLGGKSKSAAKVAAVRRNGKKGGRPRKSKL